MKHTHSIIDVHSGNTKECGEDLKEGLQEIKISTINPDWTAQIKFTDWVHSGTKSQNIF